MNVIVNDTKYGIMMYLKSDVYFVNELLRNKIWDQDFVEMYRHLITHCKVILDIGAHCGSHSVMYSRICPGAIIHSFEPQRKIFELLNMNLKLNEIKNVKTYNIALGNKRGIASMNRYCVDGPNTFKTLNMEDEFNIGGLQIGKGGEEINIEIIDEKFSDIGKIDFIKIDVEGFESFVVDGGIKTIIRDKPIIVFEHNFKVVTDEMNGYYKETESIMEKLDKIGYKIMQLDNIGNFIAVII